MTPYNSSQVPSAWRGLEPFAHWLVQNNDPKLTVELGCDYGFSLIELARYSKGLTVGVDHFQGDGQAGYRDVREQARKHVADSGFQIELMEKTFEDALPYFGSDTIDILHIDGAHDFNSVRNDFDTWIPKVRSGGVILMHDTQSFANDVGRFFRSITFPKFEITYSHGLGVVLKP